MAHMQIHTLTHSHADTQSFTHSHTLTYTNTVTPTLAHSHTEVTFSLNVLVR